MTLNTLAAESPADFEDSDFDNDDYYDRFGNHDAFGIYDAGGHAIAERYLDWADDVRDRMKGQ